MLKKLPPEQKVYEAFSALADGRVELSESSAVVYSSDRSKKYNVKFEGDTYASSDSATYWQGYPGYPVIAVLILQGRLPYEEEIGELLKGIAWKQLNDKHKRDYDAALQEALSSLSDEEKNAVLSAGARTYEALCAMNLTMKRTK